MPKKVLNQKTKDYVVSGSADEKQYLDELSQKIMDVNEEFVDFVARQKSSDALSKQRASLLNNQYNQRLFMMLTTPLRQGLNKRSLLMTIGIGAGAMLMSPDFRKSCSASVQNMMYPYIEKLAQNAKPGSFWARQKNRMELAANGGRLPLTTESAAIMHLGLTKNAFNKMRQPGANVDKINEDYQKAMSSLNEMVGADGLDMSEVQRSVRTMAGQLMERDPKLAMCFAETSVYGIKRGPGQVKDDGVVWRGEFVDGKNREFNGTFAPRVPMDAAKWEKTLEEFYYDETKDCETSQDVMKVLSSPEFKQNRRMRMDAMFTDGLDEKAVRKCTGSYMDHMYGSMFNMYCNELFKDCKTRDDMLGALKSDKGQDDRRKYLEVMLDDGLSEEQVRAGVRKYMNKSIQNWADWHGIDLANDKSKKQPQKDPQPAPEKNNPSSRYQKPRSGQKNNGKPKDGEAKNNQRGRGGYKSKGQGGSDKSNDGDRSHDDFSKKKPGVGQPEDEKSTENSDSKNGSFVDAYKKYKDDHDNDGVAIEEEDGDYYVSID